MSWPFFSAFKNSKSLKETYFANISGLSVYFVTLLEEVYMISCSHNTSDLSYCLILECDLLVYGARYLIVSVFPPILSDQKVNSFCDKRLTCRCQSRMKTFRINLSTTSAVNQ